MFNYKKSRKVLVLTAAVSLLCSQSVFAETLELDLDDALQRSLTTNQDIQIHSGIQLLAVIAKILVILTVILLPLRFPFILVDNYQE